LAVHSIGYCQNYRTPKFAEWVAKKYNRIAVSQLVEDGVNRERRSEVKGSNTIVAAERSFHVLIKKEALSKVHKYKEVYSPWSILVESHTLVF
jgi:hypothetical protein